ncbi:RNA binding domain-containing protein [Microsporum canis CBS 113480]|uniref:RNA binding domain-containing protein n=1 Tax=Arthroderma otae (strain ATCC MYA-4605 / CBS 113480) TaxID=554155 RepID=C5FKA0_ARTOC|nr:RNA binding domain-containing protein [Microsporum canis CBS 113480]EEQ30122.1 RNA binding domain-containing protein [Microsporum canis CBS 113480]
MDIPLNRRLEYFHKSAGPVKKVMLTYNQNGTSRGIASIIFARPETAIKAAKELNGLLIDKRPIKIEVVVDASRAPPVPTPKPLTERVAQPKAQPKPASAGKAGRKRDTRGRAQRGRNAGRPKSKTTEELDAEIEDYFAEAPASTNAAVPAANGAPAQPAANGEDLGMVDEISVSISLAPIVLSPSTLTYGL